MTKRECGSCDLCCVLFPIDWPDETPPIVKPPGVPCAYLKQGAGCSIHETKPKSCKGYACLWLQGHVPEQFKPDAIGGFFDIDPTGKYLVLWTAPGRDPLMEVYDLAGWMSRAARSNGLEPEVLLPD